MSSCGIDRNSLADIPVENLRHDDRDLWFGQRVTNPRTLSVGDP
jgi:hypothetical protein